MSRNSYFSENALNPGGAENKYNFIEHNEALKFSNDYRSFQSKLQTKKKEESLDLIAEWIKEYSENVGLESYKQRYYCKALNQTFTNVISILRSKSCGKESMALSTTYQQLTNQQIQQKEAVSSIGVSFSLFNLISIFF